MRRQRKQEVAEAWVSENATTGMLPSEMIANEGGDISFGIINDQDFSTDVLSVSSEGDSERGNSRRLEDLLDRPDVAPERKSNEHCQRRPINPYLQYQNPNCSQRVYSNTPRRYLINSNGSGRYVIDNHDLGTSHYKIKIPGVSEDINVKIGACPQYANDSSKILEEIDSMLRRQHKDLERRVMNLFDRQLNTI